MDYTYTIDAPVYMCDTTSPVSGAMSCDLVPSDGGAHSDHVTSALMVEETTVELVEQDLRRNVVNKEFMVFYGNDPTKVGSS